MRIELPTRWTDPKTNVTYKLGDYVTIEEDQLKCTGYIIRITVKTFNVAIITIGFKETQRQLPYPTYMWNRINIHYTQLSRSQICKKHELTTALNFVAHRSKITKHQKSRPYNDLRRKENLK